MFPAIEFDPTIIWSTLFERGIRSVRINDKPATMVTEPVNGPLMFEHPLVRNGRPTSWLDFQWVQATGRALDANMRVLPTDRDFSNVFDVASRLAMVEIVSRFDCHREWTQQLRWRGRPAAFTQYNLDALITWRDSIFLGKLTIRELAHNVGVSEPAAARFAHGETLWYV